MGYTHYWEMSSRVKELPSELVRDVEKIVESYADVLEDSTVNKGVLVFNGIGEAGHETFYVEASDDGFCKTNGKPYDKAVCESLLLLKHHLGEDFKLESDGFYISRDDLEKNNFSGNWNEAINNVKDKFGYEFGFSKKRYYKSESGLSTEDLVSKYEVSRDGDFFDYLDRNGTEFHKFEVLSIETYNEQKLENKKGHLIFGKEFELGVNVIDEQYNENGDLHVLCERESDGSHVVWTSFRTDDLETSYEDFYNGKYDLTREEGFKELDRRSGRGQEKLSGIYAFDESGKPSIVANNLEAFLDASVSDGRFDDFVKDGANYHVEDLMRWQEGSDVVSDVQFEGDMKELLAEYDVLLNPTREELADLSEQYGLARRHENIEGLFKQEYGLDKQVKRMPEQFLERE